MDTLNNSSLYLYNDDQITKKIYKIFLAWKKTISESLTDINVLSDAEDFRRGIITGLI